MAAQKKFVEGAVYTIKGPSGGSRKMIKVGVAYVEGVQFEMFRKRTNAEINADKKR